MLTQILPSLFSSEPRSAYVYVTVTIALLGQCINFPLQALLAPAPPSMKLRVAAHLAAFIGLLFVLPAYVRTPHTIPRFKYNP
jgi:hypothetical protein